jgi:hypothetical protein
MTVLSLVARRMVRGGLAALLLGMAACSPPLPPWTLTRSPDDITLRWYPDNTPSLVADQVAELHCRSWGKSALLASDTQDGSAEIAQYRCR